MIYKRKINDLELKDFDQKAGIVTFYFANFGNKDSDNDIIQEGSYTKTLNENRKRIKHFKNHDATQVPGFIMDIQQDHKGAFAVSQLAKTTLGRDTLIEYESGIISEHSQGFNIIKEEFSQMDGANIIKEIRLWEVSS
jgi:HK97 family phage prohead protease